MPPPPSLAAIFSRAPTPFSGSVYRVVPCTSRGKILSTEGNRNYAGRYHVTGETGVLYTSLKEGIAVREILRHAPYKNLKEELVACRIRVRLQKVLDLSEREGMVSPDYSFTQAISLQARRAGFQGLLVPSATGQGNNLIVFENNLGEGCLIEIEEIH